MKPVFVSGQPVVADQPVLNRSTFVTDCQTSYAEVCSEMNERCAPFLCTREKRTRTTFLEATGTAYANTSLLFNILTLALALALTRWADKTKVKATQSTSATTYA